MVVRTLKITLDRLNYTPSGKKGLAPRLARRRARKSSWFSSKLIHSATHPIQSRQYTIAGFIVD